MSEDNDLHVKPEVVDGVVVGGSINATSGPGETESMPLGGGDASKGKKKGRFFGDPVVIIE
jgi:hypothetical protein